MKGHACQGAPYRELKPLWAFIRRRLTGYAVYIIFLFLSSLTGLFVPWYIKGAIDSLRVPDGDDFFIRYILLIVLFACIHMVFRFLARRGFLISAREIEGEIREKIFSRAVDAPYEAFSGYATGDLMSRSVNDLSSLWLLTGPGFLTLVSTTVTYVLALFFMLKISVALTLVILSVVPVIIILARFYSRRLYRLYRDVQETLAVLSDKLNNFVTGMRIIKSYAMEEFAEREFEKSAFRYSEKNIRVSKISAFFHGTVAIATGVGALAVLCAGGFFVIKGKMSIGSFVAFTAYIGMLSFPTIAMGWVLNLFQRGASAWGRIDEIMTVSDGPAKSLHGGKVEKIEFREVSFAYPGSDLPVLNRLSFSLHEGEALGITGFTGSGKSTIVKLLLGLYLPQEGTILLNGRPLWDYDLAWVRKKIGVAFQDSYLFSESVLENISFPLDFTDLDRSQKSAILASVDGDINSFPGRYDTLLGERGVTLSGGQRQRVSLARTITYDGDIWVLDDSFSSVDMGTENEILKNMATVKGKKTLIVISHRLSTLSLCDRIMVMKEGRVVEEGGERELRDKKGLYYQLFLRQTLWG